MDKHQEKFVKMALSKGALKFGEFTLKSGRKSPYFFNAGLLNDGHSLSVLGEAYAHTIMKANWDLNVLFGPAYKGIPLASAAAISLSTIHNRNVGWSFNRKEDKDHGEGGRLVGHALEGNVVIVDDVITAGTAIRSSMEIIEQSEAQLVGIVVALDRQEKGAGNLSAIQEIENLYNVPVLSILKLDDLIEWLNNVKNLEKYLVTIKEYRKKYGI